jgi:hypothetical protein
MARGGTLVDICEVLDGRFLRHLRASPSGRVRYPSRAGSFSRGDTELYPSRYRKRTKHKTTTNCGTGKSSFSDDARQTPSIGIRTTAPSPTIKASSPLPATSLRGRSLLPRRRGPEQSLVCIGRWLKERRARSSHQYEPPAVLVSVLTFTQFGICSYDSAARVRQSFLPCVDLIPSWDTVGTHNGASDVTTTNSIWHDTAIGMVLQPAA